MPRGFSATLRFITDLLTGYDRKAVEKLTNSVGRSEAEKVIKQVTGKAPRNMPIERKEPLTVSTAAPAVDYPPVMVPVSSSNVHSIGYSQSRLAMWVRYLATQEGGRRSGPGPLYEYSGVPLTVWNNLRNAGSVGAAVWDDLRIRGTAFGHKFDYRLVGVGPDGNVPRKGTEVGLNPREIEQGGKTFKSNKPGTGRFG